MSADSHAAKEHILALAGGFSGIAECISVQPFDMIKTRFQLNEKGKNIKITQAFT